MNDISRAYAAEGVVGGFSGLPVLIADVLAAANVFQTGASTSAKVLWIALILVLPVLGLAVCLFAGSPGSEAFRRRRDRARARG